MELNKLSKKSQSRIHDLAHRFNCDPCTLLLYLQLTSEESFKAINESPKEATTRIYRELMLLDKARQIVYDKEIL